jgi:hypothetical protein
LLGLLPDPACQGQVLDVNGDGLVGAHEALAVSEAWKQAADSPVVASTDAELLDGLDSVQFLRSDVSDEFMGTKLTISGVLEVGAPFAGKDVLFHGQILDRVQLNWIAQRGALRSGRSVGDSWELENVGWGSVGFGAGSIARGAYSTAFGEGSNAQGRASTAMGEGSYATGETATAIGQGAQATGVYSVAVGWGPSAEGRNSTALGHFTTSSGEISTAMGYGTVATGDYSTAMGYRTTASGRSSTSIGQGIEAAGENTVAIGLDNQGGTVVSQDHTLVIMGGQVGIGETAPQAALEVIGKVSATEICSASASFGKVVLQEAIIGNALIDHATLETAHLAGATVETATFVTDVTFGGNVVFDGDVVFAGPAAGQHPFATESGVTSNSPGDLSSDRFVFGSDQLGDSGDSDRDARFFFDKSKAAFRAGIVSEDQWDDPQVGARSTAMGSQTIASGYASTAFGSGTRAQGGYSTAFGSGTRAEGIGSTALGSVTLASGNDSLALGAETTASGVGSIAAGFGSNATGNNSVAIGRFTTAIGYNSIAVGSMTTATATASIAMGYHSTATGNVSAALGFGTDALGNYSTALGNQTNASGANSTALGSGSNASGFTSTAMGSGSLASATSSTAMGYSCQSLGEASLAGGWITSALGKASLAIGYKTVTFGDYSTALGNQTRADGIGSLAVGAYAYASGEAAIALGANTRAQGYASTSLGRETVATGAHSTALGWGVQAAGESSVAIGLDDQNGAIVSQDHTLAILGGRVGVGDPAPSARLTVLDNTSSSVLRVVNDGNHEDRDGLTVEAGADDGSGVTDYLLARDGDGDIVGALRNDNGTFSAVDLSDRKSKINIQDTTVDALAIIEALRVVDFNRKADPEGRKIHGFIAQEAREVFPEMVTELEEDLLGISKDALIPILTKAIQEQREVDAELRKIMEEQRRSIEILEKKVAALAAIAGEAP